MNLWDLPGFKSLKPKEPFKFWGNKNNTKMKISEKGKELIKRFEKCSLKAYHHKGDVPTIGWGNTFYEDGTKVKIGDVISQDRADLLFSLIVDKFSDEVASLITSNVNQNQFDALCSFAYNVGTDIDADLKPEGLGDSTLLKLVNANPNNPKIYKYTLDTDGIAKKGSCEFLKWTSPHPQFVKGLRRRRQAECDLYAQK